MQRGSECGMEFLPPRAACAAVHESHVNFEEAKCWQPAGRGEAAFEESFMFDAPRSVKAVAVAMRRSQSWGYFGIISAALIAEPGPFMLVRCLGGGALFCPRCAHPLHVRDSCQWHHVWRRRAMRVAGNAGVSLEPCLLAIAAGDGREVMELDKQCAQAPALLRFRRAGASFRSAYTVFASLALRSAGGRTNREHG